LFNDLLSLDRKEGSDFGNLGSRDGGADLGVAFAVDFAFFSTFSFPLPVGFEPEAFGTVVPAISEGDVLGSRFSFVRFGFFGESVCAGDDRAAFAGLAFDVPTAPRNAAAAPELAYRLVL
jgi:hypothetical protein